MTPWNATDDATLRHFLEQGNGKLSWSELSAAAFPAGNDPSRSKDACMERWRVLSKPKPLRGPWMKAEDSKLNALVAVHGHDKWVAIAAEMITRSGKQCRERWHNHLDPNINKGEWTAEEDAIIHEIYAQIGSRWAEMAKSLPGRPDNAIKNYWNAAQIRAKRARGGSVSTLASIVSPSTASVSSSGEQSPTMSRSNSTTRFAPYNKSSPMSKSRSEQFISTALIASPIRKASVGGGTEGSIVNGSPLKSPLGMSRSHSLSTFATPAPSSSTSSRSSRPLSTSQSSRHVGLRDLSKELFEPHSPGKPAALQYRSRVTPPATPELSPRAALSRLAEFPFYSPSDEATSPLSSGNYHQPSVHQVFDSSSVPWLARSDSFQDLEFSALQVTERNFETFREHPQQVENHAARSYYDHTDSFNRQQPRHRHDPSNALISEQQGHLGNGYSNSSSEDQTYQYSLPSHLMSPYASSTTTSSYTDSNSVMVHPHHQLSNRYDGGEEEDDMTEEWIASPDQHHPQLHRHPHETQSQHQHHHQHQHSHQQHQTSSEDQYNQIETVYRPANHHDLPSSSSSSSSSSSHHYQQSDTSPSRSTRGLAPSHFPLSTPQSNSILTTSDDTLRKSNSTGRPNLSRTTSPTKSSSSSSSSASSQRQFQSSSTTTTTEYDDGIHGSLNGYSKGLSVDTSGRATLPGMNSGDPLANYVTYSMY